MVGNRLGGIKDQTNSDTELISTCLSPINVTMFLHYFCTCSSLVSGCILFLPDDFYFTAKDE